MSVADRLCDPSQAAGGAHSSMTAPEPRRGLETASGWWVSRGSGVVETIARGTAAAILTAHRNAVSLAQRELQNMAFVLAARANSEFNSIERVQRNLVERLEQGLASPAHFERKFSGADVHEMLGEKRLGLPYVGALSLVDADGKLFNFSQLWPAPNISISDRNFFMELKANPLLDFAVSE